MSVALANVSGSTSVTAEILNDVGGLPGSSVLFSALGATNGTNRFVTFTSNSGSTLTAGTSYWATLLPSTNAQDSWFWNSLGVKSNEAFTSNSGATYSNFGMNTSPAFTVATSSGNTSALGTPEPGSLVLLFLSGLPVIGVISRQRRKAA